MTFKSYIQQFLFISMFLIVSIVSLNIYLNPFGLFGNVKGKEYRTYYFEKSSKYLFSFNYIPSNFDGILIGPSFSDQMMDTKKIKNHKFYNLSMDGGNISELKLAVDNVFKYGAIKTIIICLDPYITKNSGVKSSPLNKKIYYSTLGSLFTLKFYITKLRSLRKSANQDIFFDSYWGYTDNEYNKRDENSTLNIDTTVQSLNDGTFDFDSLKIDDVAYKELKEIIETAREKNIKIVAYYYPRPKRIFEHNSYKAAYTKYKYKINKLLDYNNDLIIDFTSDNYDYIREDDKSYSDGAHLSRIGANKILNVLNYKLNLE